MTHKRAICLALTLACAFHLVVVNAACTTSALPDTAPDEQALLPEARRTTAKSPEQWSYAAIPIGDGMSDDDNAAMMACMAQWAWDKDDSTYLEGSNNHAQVVFMIDTPYMGIHQGMRIKGHRQVADQRRREGDLRLVLS
jgi:hypothetical protein